MRPYTLIFPQNIYLNKMFLKGGRGGASAARNIIRLNTDKPHRYMTE